MNNDGPDTLAPTGSVKDFYYNNSYGLLTIESTVVDWVIVPETEAYYADGDSGTTKLFEGLLYALQEVDESGQISFSDFDQDGDNYIDAITFFHVSRRISRLILLQQVFLTPSFLFGYPRVDTVQRRGKKRMNMELPEKIESGRTSGLFILLVPLPPLTVSLYTTTISTLNFMEHLEQLSLRSELFVTKQDISWAFLICTMVATTFLIQAGKSIDMLEILCSKTVDLLAVPSFLIYPTS